MCASSLNIFNELTSRWFTQSLGIPTAVQQEAWPAISTGKHTLVSAPTGTGKTLSAFLVFIDRMKTQARVGTLKQELQLIYISPLKSLAGDIRENLRRPLSGISEEERKAGISLMGSALDVEIAVRTGDTTQEERRRMIKHPPNILITTPESLYILLSSKSGKSILCTANAIIIDELHALIDSKRGAHLMLSLARLDKLCGRPLQRIGLSATIEPLDVAAEYLAPDPVTVVAPKMKKDVMIRVTDPLPENRILRKDPVWQEIASTLYDYCSDSRSVIAFVEGRRYAEKLAYYVNEVAGEGFARTHHGSLSKEQRFEVENALRNGKLRLLCATSSMELGIDVGDIDQVFQIGCPRSISSTMQRLGRAGHNPNRTSVMHIFPRTASEGLYCGMTAKVARGGGVEYSKPPRLCLDVLAQHLVSMATGTGYELDEVMDILARAYPFKDVTRDDIKDVLCMLAGDYEHQRDIPVRPRILYDRIHERVEGDPYSRLLAVSAGGTIPDKGLYAVKTDGGVKLGELDEEFIFESQVGDKFVLGTFAWQIVSIQKDTVVVTQAQTASARLPFWKGEIKGRRIETGIAFGTILRKLGSADESGTLFKELCELGLDDSAAKGAADFIRNQIKVTEGLPDDRTIIIEHFHDETGTPQMMVHSVFGRQVNAPLAILAGEMGKKLTGTNICCVDDDDGFLLFPYCDGDLPEGVLQRIQPESVREVLAALLPATPLFNMNFRYNSARALMMGMRKSGRQPLWVQRLRSTQMLESLVRNEKHPLIRETKRECLEDYWDVPGVEYVINGIRSGSIHVREMYVEAPSPMSFLLRQQTEAAMMYDYSPTTPGIYQAADEALKQTQMIEAAPEQLAKVSERTKLPKDAQQLHSLLMIEGDLIAGDLEVPIDWLESLADREQVKYIEPGLWIAAEQEQQYMEALEHRDNDSMLGIVRRLLRYRAAKTPEQISERYLWNIDTSIKVLSLLCEQESAVENDGLYYHAELYDRARRETVKNRRTQVRTMPAESYAALLASRLWITAPPAEQLERAMKLLCGQPYAPALWESVLLPARVSGYRPELLDVLLSQGNIFWRVTDRSELKFDFYDDVNWEADLSLGEEELSDSQKLIYDALLTHGASFVQRLTGLLGGVSPYESLMELVEKGLVCADSFMPIRQFLNKAKTEKSTTRRRVSARVMTMTAGRWELIKPLKEISIEQLLEREFDRVVILARETVQGLSWSKALEVLRVWEYTGRVRRGYFVQGLSGIQFIREKDYEGIIIELSQPRDQIVWLTAVDPAQPWGKVLPHMEDRAFINIPGTAVALKAGVPVAVFERQGKVLRVFDSVNLKDALSNFVQDYSKRRLFVSQSRILVKQYPKEAEDVLKGAGFSHEMQDFVLYR